MVESLILTGVDWEFGKGLRGGVLGWGGMGPASGEALLLITAV